MFQLNYRDTRPIYEQIKDQFRKLILTGGIAQGEKLPSVRELATQLAINPNTIQRAYRELEITGVIQTLPGKGCFVCHSNEKTDWSALDKAVAQLLSRGIDREEIIKRIGGDRNA